MERSVTWKLQLPTCSSITSRRNNDSQMSRQSHATQHPEHSAALRQPLDDLSTFRGAAGHLWGVHVKPLAAVLQNGQLLPSVGTTSTISPCWSPILVQTRSAIFRVGKRGARKKIRRWYEADFQK